LEVVGTRDGRFFGLKKKLANGILDGSVTGSIWGDFFFWPKGWDGLGNAPEIVAAIITSLSSSSEANNENGARISH